MISLKAIGLGLLSLYIFGIAMVLLSGNSSYYQSQIRELNSIQEEQNSSSPYKFISPELAYEVFTQFEKMEVPDRRVDYYPARNNENAYLSLAGDDNYCDKRRAFFVQFPETVFEEINFINDLDEKTLVRNKVLLALGNDIQPYLRGHGNKNGILYGIKPSVSTFYTRLALYSSKKIGTHFSCLSQSSNHLPGKQVLDKKDDLAEAVIQYGGRYNNRPQCFNDNKFFPKTFLLYKEADCKRFFEHFNSPQYQALKKEKRIVYMKKLGRGAHMGNGVDPLTDKEEVALKKMYENGKKCGKINKKILIQNFIHNPLLLYGRKFDFRMYMFVASSNPIIAYYHDGFLRVSLVPYDVNSNDKKSLLTNLALSDNLYNDARQGKLWEGMTIEEMKIAQQWSFNRLQSYLLETGIISDPNWLDNYLRPEFKKAMTHLLRFGLVTPYEDSSLSQFYGIDFMLDQDLNLWFIEANSAPGLGGYSDDMEKFIIKMLKDQVEIVTGLLRSRMKRVINYVNELIRNGSVIENEQGEVKIKHFEASRAKFQKLMENSFEKEFEPSPNNGFSKIIDGNYQGVAKYMGNIPEGCL